jgi:hypothetical protein
VLTGPGCRCLPLGFFRLLPRRRLRPRKTSCVRQRFVYVGCGNRLFGYTPLVIFFRCAFPAFPVSLANGKMGRLWGLVGRFLYDVLVVALIDWVIVDG